jgi:molecular chaperone DnaK (HSP70)
MSKPRYAVGIDLGTTNSALAYADLSDPERTLQALPIDQLVHAGRVEARPGLPSFLYLGGEHEVAPGTLALPWAAERNFAVGEFAREQGARVPGRLVSSAKSWLCHGGVDRDADILPWGADEDVGKLSPVEASARYLGHLREVWERRFPEAPLAQQEIILTVPASFDEVARELTVDAAKRAGLAKVVLLEEPQAAFYAWVSRNEKDWQTILESTRLIVVVDVGGGTTDFSLIAVRRIDGTLALERTAVGDHLLLGGDNIDVALARRLEPRLGARLDSQRWHALTNLCRAAKETLLGGAPPNAVPIRLSGRGAAVVGGTVTAELSREEVEQLSIEGFFPLVDKDAVPRRTAAVGLQEWGLPFASEPEVSRHLAAFLRAHEHDSDAENRPGFPDAILFNGGALKPAAIRARLAELLTRWAGGKHPQLLASEDLDLAVARGAAYYGLVRRGRGVRVGGGSPRAYYLGIGATEAADDESAAAAVLCIAPRGMMEGEELNIERPELDVITNRGVGFPLYASSTRLGDRAGQLIEAPGETLSALPPIRTVLRFGKKLETRKIPVHVQTRLTEVGTLEVWCQSQTTDHRWRLQFQLRDRGLVGVDDDERRDDSTAESVITDEQLAHALAVVRAVFVEAGAAGGGDPIRLTRDLEAALETGKDAWPLAAIRSLWDVLWAGRAHRSDSPAHEARWLNLCGFLLRPGFGADLDDWRVQQLWRMRSEGLCFSKEAQCRAEWWNLWKRIAGGLSRQQQQQLFHEVSPALLRTKSKTAGKQKQRLGPQELREFWQLMGSCERLSAETKADLGDALLPVIRKGRATDAELWSLGRLGARAPFYGPLNCVVKADVAARWLEGLLDGEWGRLQSTLFAVVQLGRCVGDRERDLAEDLRRRAAERVKNLPGGQRAAHLLLEVTELAAPERARILDESLPSGLQLRTEAQST